MIFKVRGPLRRLVAFTPEVHVRAATVNEGLGAVCVTYPALRPVLFDASGRVRGVHRLALNRTILHPSELETPVGDGDVVEVVTALAGG